MGPFQAGKYIMYVGFSIFLVVAIISPYGPLKKLFFIVGVLILGAISLGANKLLGLLYDKITKK